MFLYTSLFYFILLLSPFPCPSFSFRSVAHSLSMPLSSCPGCLALLIWLPFLRSQLRRMFLLPYVFHMWFCFVYLSFVAWVSFLSPSLGDDLQASFTSAFICLLSRFVCFFSILGRSRFGLVRIRLHLVTAAGFVTDQLMWNKQQQRRVRFCIVLLSCCCSICLLSAM